jgi:hypothetical protein
MIQPVRNRRRRANAAGKRKPGSHFNGWGDASTRVTSDKQAGSWNQTARRVI